MTKNNDVDETKKAVQENLGGDKQPMLDDVCVIDGREYTGRNLCQACGFAERPDMVLAASLRMSFAGANINWK